MKKFFSLVLVLVFVMTSISLAEETARKKVVKIRPGQIEEAATPVKTTRIQPRSLEESGSGKNLPKAQPVSAGTGADGMSGLAERGPSGFFAAVKGGFAMPRYMAAGEVGTTLVSNIMDKTDLAGRVGLAFLKGRDLTVWDVYGDLFLSWDVLRSAQFPLTINLGAGVKYPVSVNDNKTGNIGFNIFVGLNYNIFEKGQLFVESGFHTFAIKDQDTLSGVSLLGGYKHFF